MFKLEYRLLENCVLAISGITKYRLFYITHGAQTPPKLLLIGETGLLTLQRFITDYYNRYLSHAPAFNSAYKELEDCYKEFTPEEVTGGQIDAQSRKDLVLGICDKTERFGELLRDYMSRSAILQIYNTTFQSDTLFYWIKDMFSAETWADLPQQSKTDISEGGRALVTAIPTGAAFLFLRALEGHLREKCFALGLRANPEDAAFGRLLTYLDGEAARTAINDKDEVLRQLSYLRFIKDEFRNPAAHPEKTFDQREADQLFQVINVALDRVTRLGNLLGVPPVQVQGTTPAGSTSQAP